MMDDEEREASSCIVAVGRVGCGQNEIAAGVQNGDFGNGNFSEGSSSKDFRTYKRRKSNNLSNPTTELLQMIKEQGDKVHSLTLVNDAENGHLLKYPRNIVLDQICKSISETGGSLCGCLKDVLLQTGSCCRIADKDSVHFHRGDNKCQPHTVQTINGLHNVEEMHVDATFDCLPSEADCSITELCQRTFVDILMSEKFTQLCSLLMENFSGMRVDEFFDIKNINSRIENGTYENSPVLFHSDIKQLWSKVQKIGTQMVSLGNSLLEKSSSSFHEHVAGSVPEVGKHESGRHVDGKGCLGCDSCEEMCHVSCIDPAGEEIPASMQPHNNCVVCERLNAADNRVSHNVLLTDKRTKFEQNSNNSGDGLQHDVNLHCCYICRADVENNQDLKVCGHVFCPHKYYHARCLTGKQLNTHGSCWYCPSCLCFTCLLDKDDDKIVLCDGCDHAYHIYCMEPPLNTVPEGKWFCRRCDTEIQKIHRVRRAYENMQNQSKMKGKNGNLKKSGGVDMLLNAAETLEISSRKKL